MGEPISAVDRRGLAWMSRWASLGHEFAIDEQGRLNLIHDGSVAAVALSEEVQSDPLLAHAVGRAVIGFFRWEDAQEKPT
jgi:hypothetical protein